MRAKAIIVLAIALFSACRSNEPFRVLQRTEATIADLPDLRVRVGNVHLAHVDLTVVDRSDHEIVSLADAKTGSTLPFTYRAKHYALEVVNVEDHLVHDDWVVLQLSKLSD